MKLKPWVSLKSDRLRRLSPLAYVKVNSGFLHFKSLLRRQTTDLTVADVGQPTLRWGMVRYEGLRFIMTFALFFSYFSTSCLKSHCTRIAKD